MSTKISPEQRVILITGANKGIGLEAARQLSEQLSQATILLGTRSLPNGHAAITSLQQTNPSHPYSNLQPIAIDVTDKSTIAAAVAQVQAQYGHLDALLNNAGIVAVGPNSDALRHEVFATNLYGLRDCTVAFLPLLRPRGLVVNVSSETGSWATQACGDGIRRRLLDPSTLTWEGVDALAQDYLGPSRSPEWPALPLSCYTVGKALLSAWSRVLAREGDGGVRVVVTTPGWCQTEGSKGTGPRTAAQGGASVIWPITHDQCESGHFYQVGHSTLTIAQHSLLLFQAVADRLLLLCTVCRMGKR